MARRNITKRTLQTLAVPTAGLSAHQAQLKQALLASSPPTENTIKHIWRVLVRKKKFVIPGMATAMVALALVIGIAVRAQITVSAAELTQRSIQTVSSLSPEERSNLNARISGDAQKELEAAMKAKDIKILTYEEYKKQANHGPGLLSDNRAGGPDMTKLHYLVYTGNDGTHHVIGVDDSNLPVFVMAYHNSPDGGEHGSVMGVDGNGQPGTPPIFGSTQCAQKAGSDKPVCSTSGNTPAPDCTHESDSSMKCATSGGSSSRQ